MKEDVHAFHLWTCTMQEPMHISQQMQALCNQWCHPGSTKRMENYPYYSGKGFPHDFPTFINNWGCTVCNLMKGAAPVPRQEEACCSLHATRLVGPVQIQVGAEATWLPSCQEVPATAAAARRRHVRAHSL